MAQKKCIVSGCHQPDDRFGILPRDWESRELWLRRVNRLDLIRSKSTHYLCYKHFAQEMFVPSGHRLTGTAVPFIIDANVQAAPSSKPVEQVKDDVPQETGQLHKTIQTEKRLEKDKTSQLRREICELQQQLKKERAARERLQKMQRSPEVLIKLAKMYLPAEIASQVEGQINLKRVKRDGLQKI